MSSISLQTNVNALIAEQNLNVNNQFQSNTIEQLTSGYRINSSADDPAGLAVANMYRAQEAELTQGVRNANDGISTLQIADGGMSNISQMLDSLRTLATQSASDTFAGDRSTLNDQFQSLLSEIDRQAQSVGLNTGGQFAKDLSIYIGGGKAATTGSLNTTNGTVTLNLANSAVDTQALGLKGTQVVAGTSDIAAALSNGTNQSSEANNGYTNFYFSGPGFSDGSQVKVAVNLSGVNNLSTLVTAINSAIQNASQGNTAVTQAFANAGIVASVNTNATTGAQSLAFTSANSAFQVQAGDQMANAFMGNVTAGHGTAIASTVTGGATTTGFNGTAYLQISGAGLTSPVKLTLADTSTANAVSDLASQVAANTSLQAAGITVSGGTSGSPLVFTSALGDPLNIQVTGDTNGNLGFGTFAANGTAVDYSNITGATYSNTGATGVSGTSTLEFSLNGGASATNTVAVDLSGGDATQAAATAGNAADVNGEALNIIVDGQTYNMTFQGGSTTATSEAQDINTNAAVDGYVTASVNSSGNLVITANQAGNHSLAFSGQAATDLGLPASGSEVYGTSRSAQSVADALNSAFSSPSNGALAAADLHASVATGKLTITSENGTYFRLNAYGSGGLYAGSTPDIGFGTAGVASYAGPTVSADAASTADANGTTNTGALTFTPLLYGSDSQAVTFSAPDANGNLQSTTITLQNNISNTSGQSIDSAVQYLNQQLQASNNSTLQQIVAVKEDVGGAQKINFISALTGFSVSFGASPNSDGFSAAAGTTVAASALGIGGNLSIATEAGATQAVTAVANALTALGTAQGAVGQSENQLNYAVNLAQSQITNFSAAESRIRDADVASEAANLTKAQVLQQASIAAMAQANSAPQAVLALLRT